MATERQNDIASSLGFDVSGDSAIVAAARIESFVYEAINPGRSRRVATDKQKDFLKNLGIHSNTDDFLVVSALIQEELERRNLEAIKALGLKPGDIVVTNQYGRETEDVVSSISANLRIWFKGGNGRGCWPSNVLKKIET